VTNLHQQARRWAQQYRIGRLSRRDVLQRVALIAGAGPAGLALLRKNGVPVEAAEMSRARVAVPSTKSARVPLCCSFCGKAQNQARRLIAGPSVFICDECVEVCDDIIADDNKFTEPDRKAPDRRVRRELQKLYNRAGAATVKRKSFADAEAIHAWLDTPDCVYKLAGQPPRTWAEMRPVVQGPEKAQLMGRANVDYAERVYASARAKRSRAPSRKSAANCSLRNASTMQFAPATA
jgi:hypothetical protein